LASTPTSARASKLRLNLRLRLGLEHAEVVVREISVGSQAQQLGLRPGDVIVRNSGHAVTRSDQLDPLSRTTKGAPIGLEIRRDGQVQTLQLQRGRLGITTEDRLL